MKVQLHNYVRSFSTNLLGDLVSDPPAGQFSKMVNLLTDHLKDAGSAVDKSEQVNKTKADVKNQLLANLITSNRHKNAKLLKNGKRKRNEHRIDPVAFKMTKLDDGVGSRRTFSTSQEWYAGDL